MANYPRKVDMAQLREVTRKVLAYRVNPEEEKLPQSEDRPPKKCHCKERARKSK